jgi:hypothetical protein
MPSNSISKATDHCRSTSKTGGTQRYAAGLSFEKIAGIDVIS